VTLRVPWPVHGFNEPSDMHDRFSFYKTFPGVLHADLEREKALAEARRRAREDRLRASWIYGEDQPDV
jgi:hypothetical protein